MATTWTRQAITSGDEVTSTPEAATGWTKLSIASEAVGGNLSLGDVTYVTDSSGTGTLQNIDALDATTETTIENAIDSLPNLATIGGNLSITGDLTISGGNITNSITFDSGIANAGTISAGTWSGTALVAAKVPAHDDLTGFVANEHLDWSADQGDTNIHSGNYTDTTYSGGTNLTLSGTTFNVDDAFVKNSTDDTMTGSLTIDKSSGTQLYLKANTNDYATFTVADTGDLTIATIGDGSFDSDLALDVDGDIELNADGGDIVFKDASASLATINGDGLTINNISAIGSDTDKFLMSDSGVVKYVTGSNLLTYAGAQSALTFGIANTNAVKIDAADVADDEYARFTANGLESRTLGEIKTDIGTGNSALVPAAGSSGHFLAHNGAFAQVAYSNLSGTPTIPTNYVTNDADDTMAGALIIDKDSTATTTANVSGLTVDFDHTGITGGGQTINNRAFIIALNSNSPTHVGSVNNFGIANSVTGGTSGTQTNYGLYNTVSSADTNVGIYQNVTDGGTDLQLVSSADTGDYFTIATTAHGATTFATVDDDATAANLTLDIDGDIISDSHSGNFISKKAGTEFSVANSAYAGMILGYRMIGEDASHASYTLTTSYAVPDSAMTVRFIAPPSGAVEIMVQVYHNASTSNKTLSFGLSDNATYNSLGASYEHVQNMPDETNDQLVQHYWVITGLTAGSVYNYWLGAKTSGTSNFLAWGGTVSGRYGDFIMKATALPAATSNFAEYD
jgi:hypothetical protein